jgi:hypothetical protein
MNTRFAPATTPTPALYEAGGETFARCYLAQAHWPETDPLLLDQQTVPVSTTENARLKEAATRVRLDFEGFLNSRKNLSPAARVLALLNHDAYQFQSKQAFLAEDHWLHLISPAMDAGKPIEIVYPLFTKEGCAAKVLDATGPTGAERMVFWHFEQLVHRVTRIHPAGLRIHVLCDVHLYNSAYTNSPVETAGYLADLQEWAASIPGQPIVVHDYAAMLAPFRSIFQEAYHDGHRLLRTQPSSVLPADEYRRVLKSMRANINTRPLGLTYPELKAAFGPTQDPSSLAWQEVTRRAEIATREKLAIKHAAYAVGADRRLFPNALRATVHKGAKQGRTPLGLRPYPEYYRSTRILPYHGVALLTQHEESWKATVHPEIALRGRSDLVRCLTSEGTTWFYRTRLPSEG